MKPLSIFLLLFSAYAAAAPNCENLAQLKLPNAKVTIAELITDGTVTLAGVAPIKGMPRFCRVAATLTPTADSDIKIELWMPEAGWNGRFQGTGNGGDAGKIGYGALAGGVKQGWAVANTDMGLSAPAGSDAGIYTGHPERWADWGYRATHEMTVVSKLLLKAYYESAPKHSYFTGCSTGGEQALMEAQRFPDDYDGILAGAAANNRTGVHTSILWNFFVQEKDPAAHVPAAKMSALAAAVVAACDAGDGVKDGMLRDPRECKFDPSVLLCKAGDANDCLTSAQVETVRKLYAGPVNPRTKKQLYPGLPAGSELEWPRMAPSPEKVGAAPFNPLFKWTFGLDWDWRTFDFDKNVAALEKKLAPVLNATNPDLSKFRKAGHKLVVYHGWADWLVPPGESLNYRQAVRAKDGGKVDTDSYYRLFMIPGMSHCAGGPGLTQFNGLPALVDWVEKGVAPQSIVATSPKVKRPVCPHPQLARYSGTGSTDDEKNFNCVAPSATK